MDCVLQNREELLALCEFIQTHRIRSWLEVGSWTGALTRCLHRVFRFDRVAVCDDGWAARRGLSLDLPGDAAVFVGNSTSPEYEHWRATLGPIDLVFIDANHAHDAVRRDFEINRQHPHRFLAFHDIAGANRYTTGVRRFWRALDHGWKSEILQPHRELNLDHSIMGIGLWASEHPTGDFQG